MLMLYDRDEKLIASLKYNNVERKRELNGLNTLELETDKEVEYGQRIVFKDKNGLWNEYIIIDYFKNHENADVTYSVYCEDSTSELYWYFIDDLKPRNATCSSVLRRILEGTRFEVGYVDDFPKKSFNLYRESVKSCLWKILDQYGAEINVRIEVDKTGILHRYIDLRNKIGHDVGKRFTYKKDTGGIKKTTSIKDLATALHGYGKGEEIVKEDGTPSRNENKIGGADYGRKIDFSEINGGKTYVEDNEARLKYGLGKERRHIFGQANFPDCEDKHELLRLTKEKLKEVSKPKITYELNVEDVSRYEGYIGEGVDLGDVVYVIDKEIDTRVQTRVISIKDNPIEEIEDSEIVLGNFIKDLSDNFASYEKLKSVFENERSKFNQELDKLANGVKSSYIQKILDKFNRELNETGGWVYAEEGEGLLILNAPKEGNPTQAINLKGGKIAIANHKNADGSFAYETFGDGDGFTANLIRAGVLRGGKVFFNLEDGTFLIGESRTNYSMYWDGKTLHLRNVDIDLSNNYQVQNINNSINGMKDDFTKDINNINGSIGDINNNISDLENKNSILSDRTDKGFNDIGVKIETVDKKIDIVSQDFKVGQGKFESTINAKMEGLSNVVENNRVNLDGKIETYNSNNLKTIGTLKSQISQTESSITSSVASQIKVVNNKIDSNNSNMKSYVQNNYSTKTQTKDLIESEVSNVSKSVSSLESRVSSAETKISQTESSIDFKVKEVKTVFDNRLSIINQSNSARDIAVQNLQASLSIQADKIESKVSKNGIISTINQSAESVKIKASKINLDGDVSLTGDFSTYNGYGRAIYMHDQEIDFFQNYNGSTKLGTLGIIQNYGNKTYRLDLRHDISSAISISYIDPHFLNYKPYILFDKYKKATKGGYPNWEAPINLYEDVYLKENLQVVGNISSNKISCNQITARNYFTLESGHPGIYYNIYVSSDTFSISHSSMRNKYVINFSREVGYWQKI
ncbi:phage tail spike protein [Anaerococcus rubeinfantis]|uniref:phage tail spike protein n=1 Tax=Anaerococcus rubeinfantis TaxID=1720199 RepID=UPI00073FA3FB|nr:phage tail spike protein [Anaerococcus rubeinfantis]